MIYTKKQLEKMDDQNINMCVARKIEGVDENCAIDCFIPCFGNSTSIKVCWHDRDEEYEIFNPCSNWNDVMPLAYEIFSVKMQHGDSIHSHNQHYSDNKNPMRAICEVFLMMDTKSVSS